MGEGVGRFSNCRKILYGVIGAAGVASGGWRGVFFAGSTGRRFFAASRRQAPSDRLDRGKMVTKSSVCDQMAPQTRMRPPNCDACDRHSRPRPPELTDRIARKTLATTSQRHAAPWLFVRMRTVADSLTLTFLTFF